jgi:hypothetical protein
VKLATRPPAVIPQARISKSAYLVGCAITVGLWGLVVVLAAAIA